MTLRIANEGFMNKHEGTLLATFVLCAILGYVSGFLFLMYSSTIPTGY